jgi:C-terminal processing protease CtpA/Prc
MKKYAIQILLAAATLAAGIFFHERPAQIEPQAPPPKSIEQKIKEEPLPATPPSPPPQEVQAQRPITPPPPEITPPQQATPPPQKLTASQQQAARYWQHVTQRFKRQKIELDQENDPNKRLNRIRSMAKNIRIDTPRTLEWAMALENPKERRAALNAINQNALVGIGAKIKTDETGLPKIMDTTVMSAVASTGMTQPGDYISGMVESDGTVINFKNRPIQEIVQLLHGQPGTKIRLLMQRASPDDQAAPYSFDVPVQRSMIIVQPPL